LNIEQFLKAFRGDIWLCKPAQDNTSQITVVIEEEGDEVEHDGIRYGLMYYVNHHCKSALGFGDFLQKQDNHFKNTKDWLFH